MISFTLKEAADGKLTRHLSERMKAGVRNGMLSGGQRLVGIIQNELIPAEDPPPIDQRAYVAGWHAEPLDEGAVVYNDVPYAGVIEHGVRGENVKIGRAMISALAEWVVRKGFLGKGPGSIGARAQEDEAQDAAWAIAKSMQKRGIFNRESEGLQIARKAELRAPKIVAEEVAAEIHAAMKGAGA